MTSSNESRTNLPVEGAKLDPRGYYLAVSFHPPIRLDRKKGFEFAASLADYIDPSNVSLEERQWTFSQPISGSARSQLRVIIAPGRLQIHAEFPTHAKEWFEERQLSVMKKFKEHFSPALILHSAAMIRGTLPIDGDARTFLARHVMNISKPFRQLGRPIQVIGLHLVFPPFRTASEQGAKVTDWLVDVKAESLAEDPSKLFLEADAQWPETMPWNDENLSKVIERLETVSCYLEGNVKDFLQHASGGEREED